MRLFQAVAPLCAASVLGVGSLAGNSFEPVTPAELARLLRCAEHSGQRAVPRTRQSGVVGFVAEVKPPGGPPSTSGPALPFDPAPELRGRARWTSHQDEGGWFVAKDAGEWGGGLWWVEGPGHATPVIEDLSVVGVVKRSTERVAIGWGLDPDGVENGVVVPLERLGPRWLPRAAMWFDGIPHAYSAESPGGVFIVTEDSVLRLSSERVTTVVSAVAPFDRLRPLTVSADKSAVFVGMSLLGLRIPTSGQPAQWYRPENCRSTFFVERQLTFAGLTGIVQRCQCGVK